MNHEADSHLTNAFAAMTDAELDAQLSLLREDIRIAALELDGAKDLYYRVHDEYLARRRLMVQR